MVKSSSEASTDISSVGDSSTVPLDDAHGGWSQLELLGHGHVVITPNMVIDAPGGTCNVSITVRDFWTGSRIACEVIPVVPFPQNFELALLWLEERIKHYSANLPPF
jgi:hypothetical protein